MRRNDKRLAARTSRARLRAARVELEALARRGSAAGGAAEVDEYLAATERAIETDRAVPRRRR